MAAKRVKVVNNLKEERGKRKASSSTATNEREWWLRSVRNLPAVTAKPLAACTRGRGERLKEDVVKALERRVG